MRKPAGEKKLVTNSQVGRSQVRVLSMVEGSWVTGPIKPLLMFAKLASSGNETQPAVELSLVTTVRTKSDQRPGNLLLTAAENMGIQVDVLRERHAWDPRVITQLRHVIEEQRPDIVETHQVKCHFILGQALYWRQIRKSFTWIAFHHGYTRASPKLRLYEALDRWSLRRPDRVVTVCKPFAAELIRNGAAFDRVHVIPNTVQMRPRPSPQALDDLRQELKLPRENLVILSVGRLSPEKGHIDLIAAFRYCMAKAPPNRKLTLLLAGDGPERDRLHHAAEGLDDQVRLLGHQDDVWPLFFLADIFVLPSHSEGSPLVLFEAMAAERAIVATNVGGVPETVAHGVSAILTPASDINRLADALSELSSDADLRSRLGHAAHQALQEFSPEAYRDRLLTLYRDVGWGT